MPAECITNEDDLAQLVYTDKITDDNVRYYLQRAILAATNREVDEINNRALSHVVGEESVFYSRDEIREANNAKHRYMTELLNSLNPNGIPHHELKLKKNAIVMLMRNLDISNGLCNGTRLLVLDTKTNVIKCEIITGDAQGSVVFIPRITLECEKALPLPFYRKQFPLRLAFAMTINKSQGQTFDRVGVKLDKNPVFAHGQLYVAMSRVRSWSSLHILLSSQDAICKNVVLKRVLID